MKYLEQVHKFAYKWRKSFSDPDIDYHELIDFNFYNDCDRLGFKINSADLVLKYRDAIFDYQALAKTVSKITDVSQLGTLVFARWQYFHNLENKQVQQILKFENRSWFLIALTRLWNLTANDSQLFHGQIKQMKLKSNPLSLNLQENTQSKQVLNLDEYGNVQFIAYNYDVTAKAQERNFKINQDTAQHVLWMLANYFQQIHDEIVTTDVGNWQLELTNTAGQTFTFYGSLDSFGEEKTNWSRLLRIALKMPELAAFDGGKEPDKINRICLDYHRNDKINFIKTANHKPFWLHYHEKLTIDRKTKTFTYFQKSSNGNRIEQKFRLNNSVTNLLDSLDTEALFASGGNNYFDRNNHYRFTISYQHAQPRVIKGDFTQDGLPDDYPDFVERLRHFINYHGQGGLLDHLYFGRPGKHHGDYIFCSVRLQKNSPSYYYLSDDKNISVGDCVVVPVGDDDHELNGIVTKVEYFSRKKAPFPIEKTKHIISNEGEWEDEW
ncbi:hypothetical protein OZX58_02155 [Lactobacillus sp. ESL0680]|uniref:hypothetical protein n=1 Tax=Lactobacillus sp. ESL0680 TaxID=2983210 RepID=UPI0023F62FBF|nr:hypothetical protein [Lactobacillus sp. ESL0680]WEV39063.1 hypothetical protein OZX58_02155 [Lactobacillus sp. ESL0680]